METTGLLDQTRVAHLLGLSPRTLEKWRAYGGGPTYVKLGHRVLYHPKDIEAFVESRRKNFTAGETIRHGEGRDCHPSGPRIANVRPDPDEDAGRFSPPRG